jgi:DNA-binding beta-propeller fold protein YncE
MKILSSVAVLLLTVFAGCAGQTDAPVQAGVPVFEVDTSWPRLPPQYRIGDPSSIAIDSKDNVWVLHRPRTLKPDQAAMAAPAIVIFDSAGNFVRTWGGAGSGYDWPQREHGIHIDHKGYVWVGGNNCVARQLPGLKPVGDDQLVKFTQDGKLVLQVGRASQSKGNADTQNLHQPADAWVLPRTNEIFVADGYGNHRVAVYDADTGKFKRMWGAFGNKPVDNDQCPPPSLKSVPDGPGPDQFSIVHAIRVANDGTVYVADRENRRVQVFTSEGQFIKQYVRHNAPFARNLALSPDRDQRFLYVGGGNDIVVMDRKTLEVVTLIGGPGFLGGGHHIATDSKGNLYVAATGRGMQKLVLKGYQPAAK